MKKSAISLAVMSAMGATAAIAADWELISYVTKSANGTSSGVLSGDTSFSLGIDNSLVSNGAFSAAFSVGPNPLMTHQWGAGTTMSGGGTVSGSFDCIEGLFGGYVGASICGNYNFGGNYANESTINTDGSNRVIGGDDVALGPAQSVADFTGFGPNIPPTDYTARIELENGAAETGNIWTFAVVPEATNDSFPLAASAGIVSRNIGANDIGWSQNAAVVDDASGTSTGTGSLGGTFEVVDDPAGPPTDIANVTVRYTPPVGETGEDKWVYRVTDTEGPFTPQASDTATVTFVISPPGATDDSGATTRLRAPVVIPVGANDFGFTDPSSVAVTVAPTQGTTAVTGNGGPLADITITYTSTAPLGSAAYQDTFTYEVTDNNSSTDTAVVTVQVNNALPVAGDLAGITLDTQGVSPTAATTTVDVGAGGDIAGNAVGDAAAVVTTTPSNDVTSTVAGTTITIAASAFTSAGDAVGYTITDADGEAATGTISLSIPDVTPTLTAASPTVSAPGAATISLPFTAGNGAASDHSVSVSTPQFGTVSNPTVNGTTGTVDFTYTPDGFAGPDVLTVDLTDGDGSATSATATITMTGPAVTIPTQDTLPGSSAIAPASLLSLLAGLPLLRGRRRRKD